MLNLEQNLERQQKSDPLSTAPDAKDNLSNVMHTDYMRAKQELQLKRAELKDWSDILRPKHPRIVALNEDIARREKLLEIFKDQSKEQIESRRERISMEITNLDREIKELDVRSLDLSTKLSQYDRVRANKQSIQNLRDNLQRAMQSLGVEKDINPDSVTPLERASIALPTRASLVKALIIGAAVGLFAGGLLLFGLDRLDDRPASFTDVQDMFDEQVMGQIPLEAGSGKEGLKPLTADEERHAFLEA